MSVDKRDQIRTAMALPNKLFTDDGRELKIQRWSPTVSTGDQLINVTLQGFIALKPAKPEE